jgi:poly(A) polymerase/tRNA nucleotidyltransferase (CCA-adding enzyme)
MITFSKFFQESVNYQLDDFSDKWEKALGSSEELRIGLELMNKIVKLFPTGEIYIVGGVPRDLLMGNEIDDVDMATNISFEDLSKHFELRNISKNDTQPVYTILYGDYAFDLAKFREDSQTAMGRQSNVSTEVDSFERDTARRDISINSFGLDHKGRIVDHQGGLQDLQNGLIRAVGDARERFKEDATRLLRVFRFAAKMDFAIEPETLDAARELKHLLLNPKLISQESISQEMYKAAKSGRTLSNFLSKLTDAGILHDILPEFLQMDGMTHNPKHHPEGGSTVLGHIHECLKVSPYSDPVINLAVLFHDFGKATTRGEKNGHSTYYGHEAAGVPIVEGIFKRLRFANLGQHDKKNILDAVARHMMVHNLDTLNIKTLRKIIHDPSWMTVKAVAYCDEASRGPGLFNKQEFLEKIERAEAKLNAIPGGADELKKQIAQYVNGNKMMQWFPQFQTNQKQIGVYLPKLQDWVAEMLLGGREISEQDVLKKAKQMVPKVQ